MKIIVMILFILGLTACSDGVPDVDPHNVVVGGKAMKQSEFLRQYCDSKLPNATCSEVQTAMRSDSTKRNTIPRF